MTESHVNILIFTEKILTSIPDHANQYQNLGDISWPEL
jgi:hypothetical protein